jgi:hypothetical protein
LGIVSRDHNNVPSSAVYVPDIGVVNARGGTVAVDIYGNQSAPIVLEGNLTIPDGAFTALGSVSDMAWSGSGSATVNAVLKALYALLNGNGIISTSARAGIIGPAGTQPTQTNAGSDTSWSFAQQVRHVFIQNNTPLSVQFCFDTVTNAGSPVLQPGELFSADITMTTIHLLTSSSQNINGTASGNIVIWGWL